MSTVITQRTTTAPPLTVEDYYVKLITMKSKQYFKHRTTRVIKLHCRSDVHYHQANPHAELRKQGRIHCEIYTYAQNPSFHTLQNKLACYCKVDHFRSPDPLLSDSPAGVTTRLSPSAALCSGCALHMLHYDTMQM